MKVTRRGIEETIQCVTICLMISCYELLVSVLGISLYVLIVLGLTTILIFFHLNKIRLKFQKMDLLLLAMLFLIIYRNSYIGSLQFVYQLILYFICFIFISRANISDNFIIKLSIISLALYVFYSIMTFVCAMNPGFYMTKIVELFPTNRSRLIRWYNEGCNAGLTSHYSTNGMFMSIAAILTSGWMILKDKRKKKILAALFVIFIIALLLTGKRGPLIFYGLSLYVGIYFYMSNRIKSRYVYMIGLILAILAIVVVVQEALPSLGVGLDRILDPSDDVSSGRFVFWEYALSLFQKNPIVGIRWLGYRTRMQSVIAYDRAANVHNIYLQLLCETGIIGFAVFVGFIVGQYVHAVQTFIKIRRSESQFSEQDNLFMFSAVLIQTFFILYGLTGNPLYDAAVFIPYFFACALTRRYYLRVCK